MHNYNKWWPLIWTIAGEQPPMYSSRLFPSVGIYSVRPIRNNMNKRTLKIYRERKK